MLVIFCSKRIRHCLSVKQPLEAVMQLYIAHKTLPRNGHLLAHSILTFPLKRREQSLLQDS